MTKKVDIPFEEKAKIFDILRFTPCTYTLHIWGYGGDCRFLKATKEQYKYFRDKQISIDDYAWEDNIDVPEEFQPFPPGSPFEGYELEAASGSSMDDSSTIQITDENNNTVFSSGLDLDSLEQAGVETIEENEFYPDYNCEKGDVLIYHANGEKGTFFGTNIHMTKPFDPTKLKISYVDINGWSILTGVSYLDEYLDNDDYSTNGKWSETSWYVVGGEEELDGPNTNKSLYETTEWYPVDTYKPARKGFYECKRGGTDTWPWESIELIEWTGRKWKTELNINQWRGITADAYIQSLRNRE